MKPHEFKDCTFKEIKNFVQSSFFKEKEEFQKNINLLEALSDKLLGSNPYIAKNPSNLRIKDMFKDIFETDETYSEVTDYEEIIKNMRSLM